MEMQYFKEYSPELGRDMECKLYGHAGRPMLYIPCQDGRFFDFENFHMTDTLAAGHHLAPLHAILNMEVDNALPQQLPRLQDILPALDEVGGVKNAPQLRNLL